MLLSLALLSCTSVLAPATQTKAIAGLEVDGVRAATLTYRPLRFDAATFAAAAADESLREYLNSEVLAELGSAEIGLPLDFAGSVLAPGHYSFGAVLGPDDRIDLRFRALDAPGGGLAVDCPLAVERSAEPAERLEFALLPTAADGEFALVGRSGPLRVSARFRAAARPAAAPIQLEEIPFAVEQEAQHLNGQAWNMLTSKDPKRRDPAEALKRAERAVELTKRTDPAILDTYAEALFQNGDAARALEIEQYALEILPAYFEHRVPPLDTEPRARLKKSLTDGVEKYRAAVEKGR